MPVVTDYTALLSGSYWGGIEKTGTPVIVTYSFPTSAPSYVSGIGGFTASTAATFQAFTNAEQAQARAALAEWSAASGLTFIEVAPGNGDINFQLVDFNTTSYSGAGGVAFYPFGNWNFATYPSFNSDLDASGDVFMNSQFVANGQVNYGTLLHEIGHAIGLKHPTEVVIDYAPNPDVVHDQVLSSDDPTRTIMATVGEGSGAPDHLRTLDQQAAAFIYGSTAGSVVTGSASGSNAVLSSWSWDATAQVLTETGFATADVIRGSSVKDVINGLGGNDKLFGLNGDDTLNGSDGNDYLDGGPGSDTMTGGKGDDTYIIDGLTDTITESGGQGYDSVVATFSYTLKSNFESLQVFGVNLTAKGNGLGNALYGDGANATKLYGYGGSDYIVGGTGNDLINGGTSNDWMYGGEGDDKYYVDDASDYVGELIDAGTDRVYATVSYTLAAGSYVEYLYSQPGSSGLALTGNEFANKLYGDTGNNTLSGGAQTDTLYGGDGADRLIGGAGIDQLYGQGGADTFVLTNVAADRDTIHDFTPGTDVLEISAALFGAGLNPGALDASRFEANGTGVASTSADRFVYNTTSGALYFDDDGNGAHSRRQIATLSGAPTLSSSSFTVV